MTAGTSLRGCAVLLCAVALAGPAAAQEDDGSNPLLNIFRYGGTTKPPEAPANPDDVYCPIIDITEGGSSIQSGTGTGIRHQISLAQVSRECGPGPGGSVLVKVGVQGRVLLGPAGAPGRFEAPVTVTVKQGGTVFARRTRRASVTIPAGAASASFAVVEDGITVPARAANEFEIEVGLGGAGKPAKRGRGAGSAPAG
ncbi:conserved hypothetical protein [Methylobacterium sp. 4-46]|uniref:hypothetical protein n=1 Tax=unclassified Methylobacterium TaxID=2615210 RepID=UPI000165CDF9|nr:MULTISPECIES: hypothetical protein [Methylobacterium]ACA19213.1 conserved hypothetical protein [Methylobacterium sp. 4-46]WFT78420.1 hypothetical protein QA634_24550 [Methylobacterium nodulans]